MLTGGVTDFSVDSGSTAICKYDAVTKLVTALAPGICDITASKAADSLFNAETGKLRILIAKTAQAKPLLRRRPVLSSA